ncbi:MAG: PBP1A family penicillin-binding protein [Deltaproteobacteria bacterium]|nr:PBP1A family penicillin-binding protein [Deltaproteobacteria bacterium]
MDYNSKSKRTLKKLVLQALFTLIILSLIAGAGLFYYLTKDLPGLENISAYRPDIITKVYSADEVQIGEFAIEKREVIPISKVPKLLIQAFVAAEDDRFFEHEGLDFISILRAFIKNVRAGRVEQGGSTITQQVAKSLLTPERTYKRKFKEAVLAYRIENNFTKSDILYLYLNQIYLGHGAYGVQAAAQSYYNKNVDELNLAEIAMLAGLPQAPSRYSPASNPEQARERQRYVLNRMADEGYINVVEATDAMNTPVEVYPLEDLNLRAAPYFTEHVRRYLERKYGADLIYKEGLKVFTTLDIKMQKAAQKALKKGLFNLDRRQGYRGPERRIADAEAEAFIEELQKKLENHPVKEGEIYKGIVVKVNSAKKYVDVKIGKDAVGRIPLKDMQWARLPDHTVGYLEGRIKDPADALAAGDVIDVKITGAVAKEGHLAFSLHQDPLVQGALMAIDPQTGYVKSMVGGYDFVKSKFNRAIQSRRQPGSCFKPIIYSSALDNNYTPATIIHDSPIIYQGDEDEFTWKPKNYSDKFYGPTRMRMALQRSMNVVTIKIVQSLGLDYIIEYARRMGIKSHLDRDLSLSLGSSGLSLQEITSAFGIFPGGGIRREPIFITKIVDRDGNVLEEISPDSIMASTVIESQIVEEEEAQGEEKKEEKSEDLRLVELPDSLKELPPGYTISPQTAYLMTSLMQGVVQHGTGWKAKVLKRPVGGKTGTTNDLYDAWFIGFTPDLVAGTWVGFDQEAPLGKNETGSRAALPVFVDFMKEVYEGQPVKDFPIPDGIVFAKIDAKTGLLAAPDQTEDIVFEAFKEGTAPTKMASQAEVETGIFLREEF